MLEVFPVLCLPRGVGGRMNAAVQAAAKGGGRGYRGPLGAFQAAMLTLQGSGKSVLQLSEWPHLCLHFGMKLQLQHEDTQ